jgi:hypothetical protein
MSRSRDLLAADLRATGHDGIVELWHTLQRAISRLEAHAEQAVTVASSPKSAGGGIITPSNGTHTDPASERAVDWLHEAVQVVEALTGTTGLQGGACALCRNREAV